MNTRIVLVVVMASLAVLGGCIAGARTPTFDGGTPPCTSDVECADSTACTTDTCSSAGTCDHFPTLTLCAAGESCNPMTGCERGRTCATNADCPETDTDVCTTEQCDPAARVCSFRRLDGDGDGEPPRVCGGTDCDDSNPAVNSAATEACNGIDDDCDGEIDEAPAVLTTCGPGAFVCTDGECVCTADTNTDAMNCGACGHACVGGASCTGGACCTPSAETCNNLDDNCNGVIDDGVAPGESCTTGTGACQRTGTLECASGTYSSCNAIAGSPTTETCNGIDDDCDGTIDNAVPAGLTCSSGTGACLRTGTMVCTGGTYSTCSAVAASPTSETCNDIDDDCDGTIDNAVPAGASCVSGVGACARTGTLACVGGSYSSCSALAGSHATEICNGVDDNCDGTVDEGCPADDCTSARAMTLGSDGVLSAAGTFAGLTDNYITTCGAGGAGGRDAVYYFDLTTRSDVVITTDGGAMDTILGVGTVCSGTGFGLGCNDDIATGNYSSRIFLHGFGPSPAPSAPLRVYVLVDAFDGTTTGSFAVTATITPAAADTCAAPIDISGGGTLVGQIAPGITLGSSYGACQPVGDRTDPEAVARLSGAADGTEAFTARASTFVPVLYVRETTCGGAASERSCVLGTAAGGGGNATLNATIASGADAYIFIDNALSGARYSLSYTP